MTVGSSTFNEQTSPRVASLGGRYLRDSSSTVDQKSMAGSVMHHARDDESKKAGGDD